MLKIDMVETGKLIRKKCDDANITPQELCRHLNLSTTTPYYWFEGKSLPRLETYLNLADWLNCDIKDLYVVESDDDWSVERCGRIDIGDRPQ